MGFKGFIRFNSINVNSIDENSGIFTGNNNQYNWSSHSKENSGFGTIKGKRNLVIRPYNIVIDPDQIDNPNGSFRRTV
ncbi:hypothetical protein NC797_13770 [Aquibacillus sp. 3ASR75-11]|uniref:Spore germination protein GerPA/GerPF n=1 Tax=Terrihalobacillus insolitus TaxID=2950438 RepID=A0A9X3WTT5_9BACI|nr:hypothetical protein [Terrihalobacillus insolitus]MDC3413711.1 hypothetical protein [Terrihalobacillus insolitus]MDC3425570.1 hypothetical protein [Terrihalobacillus insolitus]